MPQTNLWDCILKECNKPLLRLGTVSYLLQFFLSSLGIRGLHTLLKAYSLWAPRLPAVGEGAKPCMGHLPQNQLAELQSCPGTAPLLQEHQVFEESQEESPVWRAEMGFRNQTGRAARFIQEWGLQISPNLHCDLFFIYYFFTLATFVQAKGQQTHSPFHLHSLCAHTTQG